MRSKDTTYAVLQDSSRSAIFFLLSSLVAPELASSAAMSWRCLVSAFRRAAGSAFTRESPSDSSYQCSLGRSSEP